MPDCRAKAFVSQMNLIEDSLPSKARVSERSLTSVIPSPYLRAVAGLGLFGVGFYFAYRYGMSFSQVSAAPFWFPDSVLLCALLLSRPARWWVFIVAALPIRLFTEVAQDVPTWFLLTTFAIDSAKGLMTAFLLRRFVKDPTWLETAREYALFCLVAALLVPTLSAFAGAAARHALGHNYWRAWEQWFSGNALAHLILTPAILYWIFASPWKMPLPSSKRCAEAVLLGVGLVLTTHLAFRSGRGEAQFTDSTFFAPVPFLFWAAIRFGMAGASGAIMVLTVFSVEAAQAGRGPFSAQSPADTALALQHFLLLRAAPLYLVAILIEQTRGDERCLRASEARYREVSSRLITAQEDERKRVARELHDDLSQRLALLSINMQLLSQDSAHEDKMANGLLDQMVKEVKHLSSDVHQLSYQLHPTMFDHFGLVAAAKSLCREMLHQPGMQIHFTHDEIPRNLDSNLQVCLYRVLQEALRNSIRHSGAKEARAALRIENDEIRLVVSDDGKGFDLPHAQQSGGLGLISMKERVRQVHGTLALDSSPGEGTRIEVRARIEPRGESLGPETVE